MNDYHDLLKMINSEEYIRLKDYYTRETFWDATGTARLELPHSSFIHWLLNPDSTHGMGDYPLRKFIETVIFAKEGFYGSRTFAQKKTNLF